MPMIDINQALSDMNAAGGRLDVAWNAVLELMRDSLAPLIAEYNARHHTDVEAPANRDLYLAGVDLQTIQTPSVLVGMSLAAEPLAPRVYGAHNTTALYVLSGHASNQPDLTRAYHFAQCVHAVMFQTGSGWNNQAGLTVWNACEFLGFRPLPPKLDAFSGWTLNYQIDQDGLELWPPI